MMSSTPGKGVTTAQTTERPEGCAIRCVSRSRPTAEWMRETVGRMRLRRMPRPMLHPMRPPIRRSPIRAMVRYPGAQDAIAGWSRGAIRCRGWRGGRAFQCFGSCGEGAGDDVRYLIFATGPQGYGARGGELRQRLAIHLSAELRCRIEVFAVGSYRELYEAVHKGTGSLAWLPPALFADTQAAQSATPLVCCVRHGTASFRGALFVREDSPIRTLEGLGGKTVGWVDPDSCAGHLFPRIALLERGFDPDNSVGEQRFLGSHGKVARAVLDGEVDVGAGFVHCDPVGRVIGGSWSQIDPEAAVRSIVVSDAVPPDVICASAKLEPEVATEVQRVLVGFGETREGREVLEGLFHCGSLSAEIPRDYDAVRRVRRGLADPTIPD